MSEPIDLDEYRQRGVIAQGSNLLGYDIKFYPDGTGNYIISVPELATQIQPFIVANASDGILALKTIFAMEGIQQKGDKQ